MATGLNTPQTYTTCIVGFLYSACQEAGQYGGRDTHHCQDYTICLNL